MKFKSRSTLGVFMGITSILIFCFGALAYIMELSNQRTAILKMRHNEHSWKGYDETDIYTRTMILATFFIVCLFGIFLSVLLIIGIVKKRHTYMAPWVGLSIVGYVGSCIGAASLIITTITLSEMPVSAILGIIIVIFVVIAIQSLTIYSIYTLYTEIRNKIANKKYLPK